MQKSWTLKNWERVLFSRVFALLFPLPTTESLEKSKPGLIRICISCRNTSERQYKSRWEWQHWRWDAVWHAVYRVFTLWRRHTQEGELSWPLHRTSPCHLRGICDESFLTLANGFEHSDTERNGTERNCAIRKLVTCDIIELELATYQTRQSAFVRVIPTPKYRLTCFVLRSHALSSLLRTVTF